MKMDQDLREAAERQPDRVADVILTCGRFSERLQADLETAGFEITSTEQVAHGLIYGRIRLLDLEKLVSIAGIESASLDSEQYAL
jgi:hypothetical protein